MQTEKQPTTAPAVGYMTKRNALHQAMAARTMGCGMATAHLMSQGRGREVLLEMLAIQNAVRQELARQTQAWVEGLESWTKQLGQTSQANSMASLTTQEGNLAMQLGNLATAQATDFMGLIEGLTVGYGFWAHQACARPTEK